MTMHMTHARSSSPFFLQLLAAKIKIPHCAKLNRVVGGTFYFPPPACKHHQTPCMRRQSSPLLEVTSKHMHMRALAAVNQYVTAVSK
jgi:hypothetical protein